MDLAGYSTRWLCSASPVTYSILHTKMPDINTQTELPHDATAFAASTGANDGEGGGIRNSPSIT